MIDVETCVYYLQIDQQPKQDHNYAMNIFYVVFITMGSFFILNLFVGVVIENFSKLKQQVKTDDSISMPFVSYF